ncbi:hypothetical protein OEA41_007867 [Lepraria neglecta]|uniref:CT20-domain-containing protein n=1 Tax=Lepraria neglecta TaxID=209136 RepID=A0AAD9ZH46_9LECA|nr:hypothetical protein OEA41_007867 [Lepraria neglecta]
MPPKKKAPRAARHDSTPSGDAAEQATDDVPTPAEVEPAKEGVAMSDAWTDEQETSLYKGMIRWKPVGMHKHFRMISISENLRNHGYNGYATQKYSHTRIPGIWEKLGTLYNLEALDIREDAMGESFYLFSLPDDEYWDMKFAKRINPEGSQSPPSMPHLISGPSLEDIRAVRRHSTVEDTDDPRSSPASAHGQKGGRSTRASKGTRTSHLAEVSTLRGGSGSKASPDQGTEDEQKDEEEDGDAMDEDEDDSKAKTSKTGAGKGSTRRSGRKR